MIFKRFQDLSCNTLFICLNVSKKGGAPNAFTVIIGNKDNKDRQLQAIKTTTSANQGQHSKIAIKEKQLSKDTYLSLTSEKYSHHKTCLIVIGTNLMLDIGSISITVTILMHDYPDKLSVISYDYISVLLKMYLTLNNVNEQNTYNIC